MSLGNLYILSAPSGAGKSSLINALLADLPRNEVRLSISHTTRNPRPAEADGVHYYFTTHAEFEDVFLDIDWQGARQIRQKVPNVKTIFILPPSREELKNRLVGRGQDSEETIAKRMAEAKSEMSHYNEFDYVIVNDDFQQALSELKAILTAERLKLASQEIRHKALIEQLLAK